MKPDKGSWYGSNLRCDSSCAAHRLSQALEDRVSRSMATRAGSRRGVPMARAPAGRTRTVPTAGGAAPPANPRARRR